MANQMVVVSRYGYRNATVTDVFLNVPTSSVDPLRKLLAATAGKQPDNFEVYQVCDDDERTTYIGFPDGRCVMGTGIRIDSRTLFTPVNKDLLETVSKIKSA